MEETWENESSIPLHKCSLNNVHDALKDSERYCGEMKAILLEFKAATTAFGTIGSLLHDVVELLGIWYEGFHILRWKEGSDEVYVQLALAVDA